jgi:hypothetical protein
MRDNTLAMPFVGKIGVGLIIVAAILPWLPVPLSDASVAIITVAGLFLGGLACLAGALLHLVRAQ